jgi:hypothetical protein
MWASKKVRKVFQLGGVRPEKIAVFLYRLKRSTAKTTDDLFLAIKALMRCVHMVFKQVILLLPIVMISN